MVRTLLPLIRLVWRDDDVALRPVAAVNLLYSVSFGTFWSFVSVWAVDDLGARGSQVGAMFAVSASTAIAANFLSGRISDRTGRKPMIVFGLVAHSLVVASLIAVDDVLLGFALVVLAGILGAPAYTGTTTIVADVVPPERQEAGYAAVRVANNLGLVLGPPVAALLLLGHNWTLFLAGVAVMGGVACAVAVRFLPAVGAHAKETLPSGALRLIARDTPFVLLLVSTLLGFMVYVPFEVVLPVVAVQSFGLAPSTWGFLMVINPLLVSLCQLRLTEAVRLVPPALKLAAGLMLMGFPFLLLVASGSVPVLALVLVLFVFGEMLWVPTSQALAARIAPEQLRGAYMGAFTGSSAIAWTLAPLIALNLRAAAGNAPMWIFFAALAIVGAFAGVAARRAADGASDLPAFAETT